MVELVVVRRPNAILVPSGISPTLPPSRRTFPDWPKGRLLVSVNTASSPSFTCAVDRDGERDVRRSRSGGAHARRFRHSADEIRRCGPLSDRGLQYTAPWVAKRTEAAGRGRTVLRLITDEEVAAPTSAPRCAMRSDSPAGPQWRDGRLHAPQHGVRLCGQLRSGYIRRTRERDCGGHKQRTAPERSAGGLRPRAVAGRE